MPILVHTLETREGPLFLGFLSLKLTAHLQSVGGPTSASTLYTSLPAQLPRARTVTFQGAEDQGSRERASPACEFPLVSALCPCPGLDQSLSLLTHRHTHTRVYTDESGIQHPRDPHAISGWRGGVSLFLQGTLHGANVQGQRVRGGSQGGYSGHHGTEIIGMKAHLNAAILRTDFPGGSDGKESTCNAGDPGSMPELGRSLEGRHGNHSSFLAWRIPTDRGACWAIVHGAAKSWTH